MRPCLFADLFYANHWPVAPTNIGDRILLHSGIERGSILSATGGGFCFVDSMIDDTGG